MKKPSDSVTTQAIELEFFNRTDTAFETYYKLRVKGFNQRFARDLLHKWLEKRSTLEAVFGKGKE